jgi:type IV secretory pathway VirB6-like protein
LQNLAYKLAAIFFLLSFTSCTDQGCIEADDFGEYEYQTLTVNANGSAASCVYDYSLDINDPAQGSGLQSYLTSGSASVYDSAGEEHTNGDASRTGASGTPNANGGCSGFVDAVYRNLCINNAVQLCLVQNNAHASFVEPNWLATAQRDTSQNYGVTISPHSEISVKASGSITLGDHIAFPTAYVQATRVLPSFKDKDWADQFFDVKSGQILNIKFSGQWDNDTSTPGDDSLIGGGVETIDGTSDEKIYNGARRTVMYTVPSPQGYSFDKTQTTETAGTIKVPLLPDADLWQCVYDYDPTHNPADCSNASYQSKYTHADDDASNTAFPLTSANKSTMLGQYGGMIRWTNDGVINQSYDPFTDINIPQPPTSITQGGQFLGDASSGYTISSAAEIYSYKVYFKSDEASCYTTPIEITVKNEDGSAVLNSYKSRAYPITITLSASWSNVDLSLEPNQNLVITSTDDYDDAGTPTNCGNAIKVKFLRNKDITITESGLVSFKMLNGNTTNTCTLTGAIINPNGSHINKNVDYTADFYEYDPLLPQVASLSPLSVATPLYNLAVTDSDWTSDKIFVRKGQKIRFYPESWNGTWKPDGLNDLNCGIGMAMKIEPRPALLCRGKSVTLVDNPSCNQDYTTGELTGCLTYVETCLNDTDTVNYCPSICQRAITCTPGTSGNDYQKSCTKATSPVVEDPLGCNYSLAPAIPTASTCDNCANLMVIEGNKAAKISQNIDQCYDLENYKGKVENIPASTGFSVSDLGDVTIAKGATTLGDFNGSYGNFRSFSITNDVDATNSNKIYSTRSPAIFSQDGRLRFLLLDGDNFANIQSIYTDNNSPPTSAYTGTNGFKIELSGSLQFSNGEMLAARLCTEDGGVCVNNNPIALDPKIVEYDTSTTPISTTPSSESNYSFLSSGTLARTTAPTGIDCTSDPDNTDQAVTSSTSNFYCHIVNSSINKLRLTFKIIDPEVTNCIIPSEDQLANQSAIDAWATKSSDGVILDNPAYTPDSPGTTPAVNTGKTCTHGEVPTNVLTADDSIASRTICTKQFYCANKYANNNGKYLVTIKTKKPDSSGISGIISNVVTPVIEVMDGAADGSTMGQAERIYKLLIADAKYQFILSLCLVVMLTFYALATLMGVSEITHTELVTRVVKIGLIYLFVSPGGWFFFNEIIVNFFKNGTDYLAFMMASSFDNSQEITDALANNEYYDKSVLFSSVDKVFGMFFSDAVQKKISALLFTSIFGVVYLWIIYLSFVLYVYAVCNAVLLYLTAQVFISILFILAPLFFIFTLFGQTKEMFDNWLKQLIGFSLQQIFLLTTLAFFNMMMYEVIKMSLGYKICWDVVWTINLFVTKIDLMSFWTIPAISAGSGVQSGGGSDVGAPSLFSILFIWVIASLMNKFVGFMTDLAASISGGLKASELGSGIASAAARMKQYASQRAGDIWKGTAGNAIKRLDQTLFDSGELASVARKERKLQHSKDQQNKGTMRDAGNKAVEDFKKNNATALINATPEEQRKMLEAEKTRAVNAKGKELGLSDKEIEKLKSSKGSTYEGGNVFGLALHSGRQLLSSGGTLTKSMDEEGVSTKFSDKTAKSAMKSKRMSEEDRKNFVQKVKDGDIKVERSTLGKIKGVAGALASPRKTASKAGSAIKRSASKALKKAKNAVGQGEYAQAEKDLVESGDIEKMATGTSFARPDAEKKLIEKKIQENRAAKKDAKTKVNNPHVVAGVEKAAEKFSVEEKIQNAQTPEEAQEHKVTKTAMERNKKLRKAASVAKTVSKNLEIKQTALKKKLDAIGDKDAKGNDIERTTEGLEDAKKNNDSQIDTNNQIINDAKEERLKAAGNGFTGKAKIALSKLPVLGRALSKTREADAKFQQETSHLEKENKDIAKQSARIDAAMKTTDAIKDIEETKESVDTAIESYDKVADELQENEENIETLEKRSGGIVKGNRIKGTMAKVPLLGKAFSKTREKQKNWKGSEDAIHLKEAKKTRENLKNKIKGFRKTAKKTDSRSSYKKRYDTYNDKNRETVQGEESFNIMHTTPEDHDK